MTCGNQSDETYLGGIVQWTSGRRRTTQCRDWGGSRGMFRSVVVSTRYFVTSSKTHHSILSGCPVKYKREGRDDFMCLFETSQMKRTSKRVQKRTLNRTPEGVEGKNHPIPSTVPFLRLCRKSKKSKFNFWTEYSQD